MSDLKHKIFFHIPNKDFTKGDYKELTVIQRKKKESVDFEFVVKIPTHLYDKLTELDDKEFLSREKMKELEKEERKTGITGHRIHGKYFHKQIVYPMISMLQNRMLELCNKTLIEEKRKSFQKNKKIFIRFSHGSDHTTFNLNSTYKGKRTVSNFNFFVGYKVTEEADGFWNKKATHNYYSYILRHTGSIQHLDTNFEEGDVLKLLHYENERELFESQYNIIDWTEEAEIFLKETQEKFEKLYNKLDDFLGDIDNDKMKQLIENNPLKLLK